MTAWLEPVERALDARDAEVTLFFRDDDAGWADERLFALLDVFDRVSFPVDLAVIPSEVGPRLAADLLRRVEGGARIGLHQHGFAHRNHEPEGRPCEFGGSRSVEAQRGDIRAGRRILLDAFGSRLDPTFTPPWNRCTAVTGECLRECGISTISRDASAGVLGVAGLAECPIRVDWFAGSRGTRLSREQWAHRFAAVLSTGERPIGVMLHHAQTDDGELAVLTVLLGLLRRYARVRPVLMRVAVADSPGFARVDSRESRERVARDGAAPPAAQAPPA